MLVAVCSDKGSPGATTTALTVASAWSSAAVLVEADPYGGDLAIRLRTKSGAALPEVPTVLTLATAARTSGSPALVTRYAQRVNDQLVVVPGHLVAEQLSGIPDWAPFAASLAASTVPVIADLGRIHAASPLLEVAARADVVLVVGRADAGSVIRLRERLNRLVPVLAAHRGSPPPMFPVLVTPDRHGAADVADLGRILAETAAGPMIVGAGYVALDAPAVARLEDGDSPTGRLARTVLMRSARALVAQVATLVQTHAAASAAALERS